MPVTSYRTCPLCEATCGLEITVDDGRVTRIRGDRADVFSKGFICPKGRPGELHEDPDRLRRPQIRRGETWTSVTWEEAFAEIEARLLPIREQHGRNSIGVYLGNPNVHGLAGTLYVRPLVKALGTRSVFGQHGRPDAEARVVRTDVRTSAHHPGARHRPHRYLLMMRPNQGVERQLATPRPGRRWRRSGAQGASWWSIPAASRQNGDEHLFIRPGTNRKL
jgi:anaerobic selenocysteine-containing dehydrogenase